MHRGLSRVTARLFIPYVYYWTTLNENWTWYNDFMGASDLTQPFFILSPICIHIYNELNIGLALYCVIMIVNVELSDWWSWKRHTGRFYFIPIFNPTEYRFESWRWSLTVTLNQGIAVWRFQKWKREKCLLCTSEIIP